MPLGREQTETAAPAGAADTAEFDAAAVAIAVDYLSGAEEEIGMNGKRECDISEGEMKAQRLLSDFSGCQAISCSRFGIRQQATALSAIPSRLCQSQNYPRSASLAVLWDCTQGL
jgi:hypothetical protein